MSIWAGIWLDFPSCLRLVYLPVSPVLLIVGIQPSSPCLPDCSPYLLIATARVTLELCAARLYPYSWLTNEIKYNAHPYDLV